MAVDDSGQGNTPADKGTPASGGPEPDKDERSAKMNAAKAFYRAMYAGEDVAPDDFGLTDKAKTSGQAQPQGPCQNCARLESQLAEANAGRVEAENHYKRMAADFENYRRRIDRERDEFQALGVQKAIESILPALDDMDRAKTSLATVTDPKAVLESLNLVFARFTKCMEAMGIKQMEVIGIPFDPRMHEPVQEIETNEFPDGVVVHELRRGYTYKDKVLRPTLVNVSSNPSGVVVPKASAPESTQAAPSVESTSPGASEPPQETASANQHAEASESADVHAESVAQTAEKLAKEPVHVATGTETAELPVYQAEQDSSQSLTQPAVDPSDAEPPKRKKLDESVFNLE